ncbi:hypothetical protein B0H12DRAFT_1087477 [Mycena haematopus]|nr:hypothetical protein B0H12DRAFT_1087477 [Mycena haematopus]
MLVVLFFVCVAFSAVIPVPATEPHLTKSVSSSVPEVEARYTELSNQGSKIFASAQWEERSFPSGVRDARDPESTIFNHNQWDNPDVDNAARSSSLIFAHAQWEDRLEARANGDRQPAQIDAERSRNEVQNAQKYQQLERRTDDPAESDVNERKDLDTSTGSVFFAHVQWEES